MADEIRDSILGSVRKLVGSDEYFDTDLIIHINTVFSKLQQMGVGPANGFTISDDTTEWTEFTEDDTMLNMVRTYMVLQIKLYFDNSTAASYLLDTMKEQSAELEWRMNSYCDYNKEGTDA